MSQNIKINRQSGSIVEVETCFMLSALKGGECKAQLCPVRQVDTVYIDSHRYPASSHAQTSLAGYSFSLTVIEDVSDR